MFFQGFEVNYWDPRYVRNIDKLPKPDYGIKRELDVLFKSSTGDNLCADVFRPDVGRREERFPSLLAFSAYGKSSQSIKAPSQTWHSLFFDHDVEAGDIDFFVERGFVVVVVDPPGVGKSEGVYQGPYSRGDCQAGYDTIEWMANQPWSNAKVGMIGISYFGNIQLHIAALRPPHLKAIMPYGYFDDLYLHSLRGGILNSFYFHLETYLAAHTAVSESESLYDEKQLKQMIKDRLNDPDIGNLSYLVRILNVWPPRHHPWYFDILMHPLDGPFWQNRSSLPKMGKIQIPMYLTGGWHPDRTYVQGPFRAFMTHEPKPRVAVYLYGYPDLPFRIMNADLLRWYSHWLLDIDTGVLDEPPIKILVMGSDQFRWENEFPLARTKWTKFYLKTFSRLANEPEITDDIPPDCLTHIPPSVTTEINSLKYETNVFSHPVEVTGQMSLHLYASIDTKDANIIARLHDKYQGESRLIGKGYLKLSIED